MLTVQEKAKQIIQAREQVIASQKDSEIFFDAITNPGKPNKNLSEAVTDYKAILSK